jgi:tetratricopeptide (TPR) repeat protein
MQRFVLVFGMFAALILSACGGDGAGKETHGPDEVILFGIVEDGPLEGARVFLRDISTGETVRYCGASGTGRCETITGDDGTFSLRVSALALGKPLEFFTSGGFDRSSGVDFAGMPMRAPLELFRGREEQISVTPLTSALSGRLKSGDSLDEATEAIALELGLLSGSEIGIHIGERSDLLRAALLLTAMAIELAETGDLDPFASLGARMNGDFPLLIDPAGVLQPLTLAEWGFDGRTIDHLLALDRELREGSGPLCDRFRKALLTGALAQTVGLMLGESDGFDHDHPALHQNLSTLAQNILTAAGDTPLPVNGIPPLRIARYVLFAYQLTSFEALTADPELFSSGLAPLKDDERIAELAVLRTLYAVSVPLLDHEIPGDDNQRRIEYFYNSDASPFFLAEKLLAMVFDDQIRDPLLVEIASGKAEVGLIDEALALVDTQVYLSESKARGYRGIGDALVSYGRKSEALEALLKAEYFAIRFTQNKGANLTTTDALLLQSIGSSFRRAGDSEGAQRMVAYLESFIPFLNTPTVFGRIIVGTWQLADAYISEGDFTSALPLVDSMHDFAERTPSNLTPDGPHFKARVFYLIETAKRFAALERNVAVEEVWGLVQALRAADSLTKTETWVYMPDVVELLYRLGRRQEALDLAALIPASHSAKAYKLVATYEALYYGIDTAMEVVKTHISATVDQVEALTYFALNKSNEYIALGLIQRGEFDAALEALDIAASLVGDIEVGTERLVYQQVIQRGYVKIADLYHLAGDDESAFEMLKKALEVARTMKGLQNEVDSLIDILLGYHQLGEESIAAELMVAASNALAGAQEVSPFDRATLYNRLIGACIEIGHREAAAQILSQYAAVAREIFDPWVVYPGNNRDRQLRRQAEHLIRAARFSRKLSDRIGARDLLFEAADAARLIYVEKDRLAIFVGPVAGGAESIVSGLAAAGFFDEALALVNQKDSEDRLYFTTPGRNQGLLAIARVYAQRDDFPGTKVASIDFDGDGRPYFFHPLASPEEILASRLILDDDSDGDGIPDVLDRRPLFADTFVQF